MTARPSGKIPTWATDSTYASGVDTGLATRVEPTSGEKASGAIRKQHPPARKWNWLLGMICDWLGYVVDIPFRTWSPIFQSTRISPYGATDLGLLQATHTRSDGTAKAIYFSPQGLWVLTGHATAERYIYGDGFLLDAATATASNLKYQHGVETGGRMLLFSADDASIGNVICDRSGVADVTVAGSWSPVIIEASGAYTHAASGDSCVLSDGTVVVVGGIDGNFVSWRSTDNGATWTKTVIGATLNGGTFQPLAGCSVGKNDRVFAWVYDTLANGGGYLFYSDNAGATWSNTGSINPQKTRAVVYVSEQDKYIVVTDTSYAVATDPTDAGTYTTTSTGSVRIDALATNGSDVLWSESVSGAALVLHTPDLFTTAIPLWRPRADIPVSLGCSGSDYGYQFAVLSGSGFRTSGSAAGR